MLQRIKKNDTVCVISGKDKGKTGKVLELNLKKSRVLVKDVAIVTKHKKARKQGEQSGIIKQESFLAMCKVMPVCSACKKPCRVQTKLTDNGKKSRACHRCKSEF